MLELYTRTTCVICNQAKDLLKEQKRDFKEWIIDKDIDRKDVIAKFPDNKLLPIVVINGICVGSYGELLDYLFPALETSVINEIPNKDDILEKLRHGLVEIVFTKLDGTERTMVATLKEELITKKPEGTGKIEDKSSMTVRCFDVEKDDWRSFRMHSLKSVRTL